MIDLSLFQRSLLPRASSAAAFFSLTLFLFTSGSILAQESQQHLAAGNPGQFQVLRTGTQESAALERQRRPLSMVSADFDGDGVADLAIGYGLNQGGAIELMRGNLDAIAPQSHASWLAAGRHEFPVPFLPATELIQLPSAPDFLLSADLNGDGRRDLVFASKGSSKLQVLHGNGKGGFLPGMPSINLPGTVTAIAAYRPGGAVLGEALLVGYETKQGAALAIVATGKTGLRVAATYALPGAATALAVANLDGDFVPDTAIVAGGQLLVLHGSGAITGQGRLETLPVSGVEAVTAGEFIFDRHAGMQLGAVTSDGDVVILAHRGLDSRPYTPEQIRAARREQRTNPGSLSLAQLAGDTSGESWTVVETDAEAAVHSSGSGTPILLRSRISGGGGDDLTVLSDAGQRRVTISHAAGTANPSISSGSHLTTGMAVSGAVVAAVPVRVNADGRPGLATLTGSNPKPEFAVPSAGNTFYVNTTADNTGSTTDADDGTRCTNGSSEICTLRDAVTFANTDGSDNISSGTSDTIMIPAGTYPLTWRAGVLDGNGNAITHLEVLGPVTFVGDTTGSGVTIDAQSNDVAFTINPGPYGSFNPNGYSYIFDTTMEDITIMNGKNPNNLNTNPNANDVGGGINWDAYGTGNLTLVNVTIEYCSVQYGAGGGLWVENSVGGGTGTVTLTGVSISSNSTPEEGGGVYVAYPPAALSATNTAFDYNTANPLVNQLDPGGYGSGGGLFFTARPASSGTPQSTLTGVTIVSNGSAVEGGGIYTNSGILLTGSVVQSNPTGQWGGGVYVEVADPEAAATITSTDILQNYAATTGGGVYVGADNPSSGSSLTLSLSRIFGNTSTNGTTGLATASPGAATATENWWGCNAGPIYVTTCDQVDTGATANPWAVLTFSSNPTTIPLGQSFNLAVDLNTDSNSSPIAGAFPAVAANYPYSYSIAGISESPTLTSGTFDSTGSGANTLSPTSSGTATVVVTFDNQSATLDLQVNGVDHFGVSAPATLTAGIPFNVTVTAYDVDNNVVTGYTGTIHFTSSDEFAILPPDATLVNGTGTFAVTAITPGSQTVSVIDSVNSTIYGTGAILVDPPVTLSATSLSFGSVKIGTTSASQSLVLTNSGTVTLSISSIAVTGANASSFVFANGCGTSLAAGANCTIHGHFSPITAGALTAAITITDSAYNSPQSVALTGTGVGPVATLSATSLSFPSTPVGASSNSQSVTLTNAGNSALSITSIAVTGTNASSFVFTNNCGTSLAAGATCNIQGNFAPTTTGALTAAVTISDNASTSPQTIALSGTGLTPPVTLSPTSLAFAATNVGASSTSQTVTMTNTGTAAVSIASIAVTGANASSFVFANGCGTSLAVGANCTIHGHFQPTMGGALTAAITITDSAATSPQSIALSGTGLAPSVTLSATSLSFGSVNVNTVSASQTVTMTNAGNATLSITSIAVTGANASSFGFGNSCGTSLAAGANCTIHGHFQPTISGALTAAVTITDSAATSPQSIALSGTGLAPSVTLSATSLSFPATTVGGSSASQSVTMTNSGNTALTITKIAVTGANASSFGFANSCGASLAAGANCSIHGHFAPTAAGSLTAAITITDSASNSPQTISLSGTGVNPPTTISLSATSLSFPATTVGMSSGSQSVTMTNTGSAVLTITSIAVTGTNASSFAFGNSCGTSLAVGANCTIHGHFAPTVTGPLTAAITITDSAKGSPQSIALSGMGK